MIYYYVLFKIKCLKIINYNCYYILFIKIKVNVVIKLMLFFQRILIFLTIKIYNKIKENRKQDKNMFSIVKK